MMSMVVTGGCGFLGREVVRRCDEDGMDVLCVGRARAWPGPSRYHPFDLTQPETLLPEDWKGRSFTLIHLAWCMSRPTSYQPYLNHLKWLMGLLDYWQPRGLRSVILPGSAEEFGSRAGCLREEDEPEGKLSPYGWSKGTALSLLRRWSHWTKTPVTWLRPFLVYGPGQSGNMVLPYVVRRLRLGETALLSDGEQERDFVHVRDVAEAFRLAALSKPKGCRILHLGTGIATPVREVLEELAGELGGRHLLRFGAKARRPEEPDIRYASTSRTLEELGWQAHIPWREGMCDLALDGCEERAWTA